MMRLLYAIVLGLTLGGLTHVASLFGVPLLASAGPYDRLLALPADGRFALLDDAGPGADILPFRDPAFVTAVCRYDLANGPVTVRAALPSTYGVLAIHTHDGQPFYALTDRATTDGAVEVTILREEDVAAAELEDAPEGRAAIRIVSPTPTGFALVRLFAPAPTARGPLRALATNGASCGPARTPVSP
jgi:uncharacterized membrane protein